MALEFLLFVALVFFCGAYFGWTAANDGMARKIATKSRKLYRRLSPAARAEVIEAIMTDGATMDDWPGILDAARKGGGK